MNTQRQPVIGQVYNGDAPRRRAEQIDAALDTQTRHYDGPATTGLPTAWAECDLIVSHLALGATTRLIAPLLADKKTDPGVVVLDEGGRFAVPLVGGHAGGANELARRLGEALGATPVLTTATDSLGVAALDTLGWGYAGDVAAVTRAVLDGRPVLLDRRRPWPMPPLPTNVSATATDPVARIVVTDEDTADGEATADGRPETDVDGHAGLPTVVLHPGSLVAGMGCNSGTDVDHLDTLLQDTLRAAGLSLASVTALTSTDLKAGELGLIQLAHRHGIPFVTYPAETLAAHTVPNPSDVVLRHVGSASVSEASVLAHGAGLVVPKQRSTDATCAIGRLPVRGVLHVVGLGPGARDLLTQRARQAIVSANLILGYGPYVKQIRDLARPGAQVEASVMGSEDERTALAIERARAGDIVALVCGGDPAIYAMASPVLERGTDGIDVRIVPGVTAELAVSAILGAPLGHDHATISLSDLHTDWDVIEQRLQAAAQGDFVTVLYNPRSKTRRHQLPRALEILAAHRPPTTPTAVVQQASRSRERVVMSTLAEFDPAWVDMNSLVVVGSSTTRFVTTGSGERLIVTPRDYHWMPS